MARWRNWSGTVSISPQIHYPKTEEEIISIVKSSRNRKIRVVGAGHSFSRVVETDDILISLDRMQGIISVDDQKVTVWAGTRLRALGNLLHQQGLAMENLGDIDVQSIAGAISTGTHGTGMDFGIISTQVSSIRIVTGQGELVDITDISKAGVTLGLLGVITRVTIKAVPAYKLHYTTEKGSYTEIMENIDYHVKNNRNFELYWFPHTEAVQTKKSNETDSEVRRKPIRNYINDSLMENSLWGTLCLATRLLPPLCKPVSRLAAATLSRFEKLDWSHKVYATARRVRFYEMEYGVPARIGPEVLALIKEMVQEKNVRVQFPIEYRYVKADDIWISPASGRDTCFIAVHMYRGMPYEEYFKHCEEIFVETGGRPHWGKLHTRTAEDLEVMYPNFRRFREYRDSFDPEGIFMTEYMQNLLYVG